MTDKYGVAAARLPTPKIRNCWIIDPPDLPRGLPITSTAALPLVLESWSNGMYAISLHGSNSEYLELLLKMFCAAPTNTPSINGVVPNAAATGANAGANNVNAKNAVPVTPIIVGVTRAAFLQPNFSKIVLPKSIIISVTAPVAEEKLPMNILGEQQHVGLCLQRNLEGQVGAREAPTGACAIHEPEEVVVLTCTGAIDGSVSDKLSNCLRS